MDFKIAPRDRKILQYLCENFSCKICNSILIQCVTLSCGHHFCNYCLDLLHAGMLHQCPQCSSTIHRAQPNNSIDQQIDNLINSCSDSIQKSYAAALNSRFQKSLERNKARHDEARSHSDCNHNSGPHFSDFLDQIRHTLQSKNVNPMHSVTRSLKSARNHTHRNVVPSNGTFERQSLSRHRSKPLTVMGSQSSSLQACEIKKDENFSEIDANKVNLLFGIYDHVLNSDNEPNKEMAAGDFVRGHDMRDEEFIVLDGMSNFTKRSELEFETLIKETDDIVRLDGHIQKWGNKIKDALSGDKQSVGIADEHFDGSAHVVDDELWKASNELLRKLQGMQKERKQIAKPRICFTCPPTPLPRSCKPNLDTVSDDSDVDEYEHALETLQECLDNSYDLSLEGHSSDLKKDETVPQRSLDSQQSIDLERSKGCSQDYHDGASKIHNIKNNIKIGTSSQGRSARRKNILDSMEESGQTYIKENIDFITKMRKYKEALMKIHNREVVTAQEIQELIPTGRFPSDGQDAKVVFKCADATTPRRVSLISKGPQTNHSYSARARLPMSTSLDRRPMTATYDSPSSQLIHKQVGVAPAKQYLKQRAKQGNSLFTAR